MLKRFFYILLSFVVLLSSFILPASAVIVNESNVDSALTSALLDLYFGSYSYGTASSVVFQGGMFTPSPHITYPMYDGSVLLDPKGYYVWVAVPEEEYNPNVDFGCLFGVDGSSFYPSFSLDYTFFIDGMSSYVIYKYFSLDAYYMIFGGILPSVFNVHTVSSVSGSYSSVQWGLSSALNWDEFADRVDSYRSFKNGVNEGLDIVSSLFTRSVLSMSYYFQGEWVDIPITAPDLDSYVTASTVNLSLLQNLGLSAADIPTNNGGVRLTFTLPRPVDISGYAFGSFNPGDIIKRYDPADVRSERYGVWFNNTETDISLWPGRNSTEDNMIRYEYFYSSTTNKYFDQVNIELNVDTLRNILSSSTPINDYVTYNLIDYNEPFDSGYTQGYDKGKLDGEAAGYESGKAAGYIQGKSDGLNEANVNPFFGLFSALIDAPISAFTNLLSFEIFGQNMASFALSILTLLLIIKIVKVVI